MRVFVVRIWHKTDFLMTRLNSLSRTIVFDHMSRSITKPTKWSVCQAKTQISLCICPVWPESSLCAWRSIGTLATHWAQVKTDQIWWMPRLIWVFAGRTGHFVGFVVLWLHVEWFGNVRKDILYIPNQNCNAARKGPDFCMTMWGRTTYLRYIAQLLTRKLWCTDSNVSTARFTKL